MPEIALEEHILVHA